MGNHNEPWKCKLIAGGVERRSPDLESEGEGNDMGVEVIFRIN